MNVFVVNEIKDRTVIITGDEHHHLSRVLRMSEGDAVFVTTGDGRMASAIITQMASTHTNCSIESVHEQHLEPRVEVTLFQAVLKNHGKMDWIVEKGTELGMSGFIPLLTERTIGRSARIDRLCRLAVSAAKQCQRGRIPKIWKAQHLTSVVGMLEQSRLLVFHESAPLKCVPESLTLDTRPIAMFIGPEGGFSDDEVRKLEAVGADVLSLGPRRLRTETASLAALTRVITMLEQP